MDIHLSIRLWESAYKKGYPRNRTDPYTQKVIEQCLSKLTYPINLIDVGCGYCSFIDSYVKHCNMVFLVDSVDFSKNFEENTKVQFVRCNLLELTEHVKSQFNITIISKLLHNIPLSDHHRCMNQIFSVTQEGGIIILTVASINDPDRISSDTPLLLSSRGEYITGLKQGFPTYRYYFTIEDVRQLAAMHQKLEIISIEEFTAQSGLPKHPDRYYWMALMRKNYD